MTDLTASIGAIWTGKGATNKAQKDIQGLDGSVSDLALQQQLAADKSAKLAQKTRELAIQVAKGDKAFDSAEKELESYRKELGMTDGATEKTKMSFGKLATGLGITAIGFAGLKEAVEVAYRVIGEGAELEAARIKFDNLSVSINSTGDAMLGNLKIATKGMLSDAELVASASDIMSLGLAKTEDGVIRMATAVGALDLDMQVLALTLANDSTMRLDNLGLSLEAVTKRKKELIASGFIGDAFDEAVLIELEQKMLLLGDASETTAGQMKIFEANLANVQNGLKLMVVESNAVQTSISNLSTVMEGYGRLQDAKLSAQSDLTRAVQLGIVTQEGANVILQQAIRGDELYIKRLSEVRTQVVELDTETALLSSTYAEVEANLATMRQGHEDTAEATRQETIARVAAMETSDNYADSLDNLAERENATMEAGIAAQAVLMGRVADFDTMIGASQNLATVISEAWSNEALAAEDSALRQQTAALAIVESYNEVALAIVQSGLQEAIAEGGTDAQTAALGYIAMQEALGTITEEEATALQQVALETLAIEEATDSMTQKFLADGQLTKGEALLIAAEIRNIGNAVQEIPNEYVVKFVSDTTNWNPPTTDESRYGLATGGTVREGGVYTVGETGAEKVYLPAGSQVQNSQQYNQQQYNISTNDVNGYLSQIERQGRRA